MQWAFVYIVTLLGVLIGDRFCTSMLSIRNVHQYIFVLLTLFALFLHIDPFMFHCIKFVYALLKLRFSVIALDFHVIAFWWLTGPLRVPKDDLVEFWMFYFDVFSVLFYLIWHLKEKPVRNVYVLVMTVCWFAFRFVYFTHWVYFATTTRFMKMYLGIVCVVQFTMFSILLKIK